MMGAQDIFEESGTYQTTKKVRKSKKTGKIKQKTKRSLNIPNKLDEDDWDIIVQSTLQDNHQPIISSQITPGQGNEVQPKQQGVKSEVLQLESSEIEQKRVKQEKIQQMLADQQIDSAHQPERIQYCETIQEQDDNKVGLPQILKKTNRKNKKIKNSKTKTLQINTRQNQKQQAFNQQETIISQNQIPNPTNNQTGILSQHVKQQDNINPCGHPHYQQKQLLCKKEEINENKLIMIQGQKNNGTQESIVNESAQNTLQAQIMQIQEMQTAQEPIFHKKVNRKKKKNVVKSKLKKIAIAEKTEHCDELLVVTEDIQELSSHKIEQTPDNYSQTNSQNQENQSINQQDQATEEWNTTECRENQPTTECREDQPTTECRENQPTTECREDQPTTECREDQPTTECREDQPTTECREIVGFEYIVQQIMDKDERMLVKPLQMNGEQALKWKEVGQQKFKPSLQKQDKFAVKSQEIVEQVKFENDKDLISFPKITTKSKPKKSKTKRVKNMKIRHNSDQEEELIIASNQNQHPGANHQIDQNNSDIVQIFTKENLQLIQSQQQLTENLQEQSSVIPPQKLQLQALKNNHQDEMEINKQTTNKLNNLNNLINQQKIHQKIKTVTIEDVLDKEHRSVQSDDERKQIKFKKIRNLIEVQKKGDSHWKQFNNFDHLYSSRIERLKAQIQAAQDKKMEVCTPNQSYVDLKTVGLAKYEKIINQYLVNKVKVNSAQVH